ncbi:AraC family transcriptional regulator [Paracoccus aerodenitrificans]|uniref:AraC family transcriptional regulator n=1 Tax=Paracoccus aerodenitrificans TaxID=3017781 RepID=UPI0022F03AC0|nr:helix-turn-helix domain-containing protein [Paracoccus aerodenitrificans]WBU64325.1 helix-turn-helix domain-containing protein [Paracoccus aerodenitrificans]
MAELTFSSRTPSRALNGLIARVSGYCSKRERSNSVEAAELVFPLVFNLGERWDIRLGHEGDAYRSSSFTAGLFPGPVAVSCDAGADLIQIDLTPLGAARLFGGAAAELAAKVVDLSTVDRFGGEYEALHDQLHAATDWQARFDLVERFLAPRFCHANSKRVQQSWHFLAQGKTVSETAAAVGWSTRHLSAQFRQETGIRPVTAARMLRFQRARALAIQCGKLNWAEIAAMTGYSDQAHLIREFHDFAGEPPTAWARRERPSEPRLHI